MAWALAHHRIFNARQVVTAVAHRMGVLGGLASVAWILAALLQLAMAPTPAWVLSILAAGTIVIWLGEKSRPLFGLDDEVLLAAFRSEVIYLSQTEAGSEKLTSGFERLLARHFGANFAEILDLRGAVYRGNSIAVDRHRAGVGALRTCVWITPESLQRRRPTPALDDLAALLRENSLGAAITVPRGSTSPTLLVVLGVKTNEWPCTYPEIRRLQNVAELMDNILTRSRFTDQAALQTRLEHLAMMSRGLAHDLKNLITPVSTFLIHTEGRYPADSAAAEVHAAAQRSVRIMTEYVREALFFADNLKPRMESVELENIFDRVREATAMRASDRGVRLAIALDAAPTTTADGVLLQRLLANLVNNAIDASTRGQLVRASAISLPDGQLRLQVVDEGVGIAPDLRARIFEPYFTTKEFGEEVRGFGLGLTIAQKIAHLHAGRISVESTPGKGTTFTVDLPPASPAGDSAAHPPTAPPAA
jgi:signal transduction histidine kinase